MQPTVNIKARTQILDHIAKNHPNDAIPRQFAIKIMRSLYMKAIDRILDGKKVRFGRLGKMEIFKRQMPLLDQPYNSFKVFTHVERALHGYYYRVGFSTPILKKRGSTYFQNVLINTYIRDKAIEKNLDLPLYNHEYKKVSKHKERSSKHV